MYKLTNSIKDYRDERKLFVNYSKNMSLVKVLRKMYIGNLFKRTSILKYLCYHVKPNQSKTVLNLSRAMEIMQILFLLLLTTCSSKSSQT